MRANQFMQIYSPSSQPGCNHRFLRTALPLLAILLLAGAPDADAQLSVRTLSTLRYGALPNSRDPRSDSYYSDLLAEYRYSWLLGGLRAEGFTSPDLQTKYDHLSQRYLEAHWGWGTARVGNVYGIFGKGIILRGFELPGFIYENRVFRRQQRVIRDVDGYKLSVDLGPVSALVLGGTPVDPLQPPDFANRRTGKLGGGQLRLALPGNLAIGAAYLENRSSFRSIYATRFLAWTADDLLQRLGLAPVTADFYGEYATKQGAGEFNRITAHSPHALYLSGNFSWNRLGGSVEFKDYREFEIGINDPPSLIRENTETLLNRATHVLVANAEKGYQVELYYALAAGSRVIANYTLARTPLGANFQALFQERYLGFEALGGPWSVRLFADSGQDDLLSEVERFTTGIGADYQLESGTSFGANLQWQRIRRESGTFFDYDFRNVHTAVHLQGWRHFNLSLGSERSTDPDQTTTVKYFTNGVLGWQPLPQADIQLFVGKRRGGTACDHGYCIEVLDFEGTELRVELRW